MVRKKKKRGFNCAPIPAIVRRGPVFERGRGSSKWRGPGFPYYFSKAGATEVKRNTGRRGSIYTSNESSCREKYIFEIFQRR